MAWWGWAIGLAVAASTTTNPLLLSLIVAVVWLVVLARRSDSPWARAFRLYVYLGGAIVTIRVVLYVLVGLKYGEHRLLTLPSIDLPGWAAGIQLLGPLYLEGLLGAALLGAQLAVLIIAIGGANALANPKRLLRALPSALTEIGTAVVVSVSVAPQLAESVQRVMRARLLRGDSARGVRALPRVAIPVLQDTLDRSLMLAAAMESRGYGRRDSAPSAYARLVPTLTLGGLLVTAAGSYGTLSGGLAPAWMGLPLLAAGVLLLVGGLWLGGRAVSVTSYRPDPWRLPETLTLLTGMVAAAALLWSKSHQPALLAPQLSPLTAPVLPMVAAGGILVAALPAVLTPTPPGGSRG